MNEEITKIKKKMKKKNKGREKISQEQSRVGTVTDRSALDGTS